MLKKGISPLLSTVLIIFITITAITLVLILGLPTINKTKESIILNEALQNMRILDNAIKEVASEGVGSKKTLSFKVTDGVYSVKEETNNINFEYMVKYGTIQPGTFLKEGNIILTSGASCKAYEENNYLVLENKILKVILLKNGTLTNPSFINTSKIIKQIIFKENNFNITPSDSSIILDDLKSSSYGYGYSKLVKKGSYLPKAEAIVHLNTSFIVYDILYTLQSGADFLTIKIINAYYK